MLGIYEITEKIKTTVNTGGGGVNKVSPYRGRTFKYSDYQTLSFKFGDYVESTIPADINAGFHSLYVYCDIIEPVFVGDSLTKLLRIVTVPNADFGQQVRASYPNPQFTPLLKRNFDEIEIDIKVDINETVPFQFGRSIVTLLFRKVNGSSG